MSSNPGLSIRRMCGGGSGEEGSTFRMLCPRYGGPLIPLPLQQQQPKKKKKKKKKTLPFLGGRAENLYLVIPYKQQVDKGIVAIT